jgi:myo-inositol-1(or 4)-monophosphatase
MTMDTPKVLDVVEEVIREAGAVVRDRFGETHRITHKGEVDLVTEVDTEVEGLILGRLREAYPDYRALSEEEGGASWFVEDPLWVVDPVDGTNNFAHHYPWVAISIALVQEGKTLIGAAYDPLRDELFAATRGGGATLNGEGIRVSAIPKLAEALLATGFPYERRVMEENNTRRLDHFLRRSVGVRRAGSATLDMAYVACGRLDGYWELGVKPWDIAATILILEEAGGRVSDYGGGPLDFEDLRVVASNGLIHDAMLRVIREGERAPHPDLDPEGAL